MARIRLVTIDGVHVGEAPPALVLLPSPAAVAVPVAEIQATVRELRAGVMGAAVALEVLAAHGIVRSHTFETLVDSVDAALAKLEALDAIMSRIAPPKG